jgi:hypothetical protein
MTEARPIYKHFFRERKSILEAALHLLKEGRFQQSAMSEIAFHARLSQSTALKFYPHRNTLIGELKEHVLNEVHVILNASLQTNVAPEAAFQNTWCSLYKHYVRSAGTLKFIDQSSTLLEQGEAVNAFHHEINLPLTDLFKSQPKVKESATAAAITHSLIIGLAKIALEQNVMLSKKELMAISSGVWKSLQST